MPLLIDGDGEGLATAVVYGVDESDVEAVGMEGELMSTAHARSPSLQEGAQLVLSSCTLVAVVVVAAHPDDEHSFRLGCHRWTRERQERRITCECMTSSSGSSGFTLEIERSAHRASSFQGRSYHKQHSCDFLAAL